MAASRSGSSTDSIATMRPSATVQAITARNLPSVLQILQG